MTRQSWTFFTDKQKLDIWDRWERSKSISSTRRLFERNSSSIYSLLSRMGSIRLPKRSRPHFVLTLAKHEEISNDPNSPEWPCPSDLAQKWSKILDNLPATMKDDVNRCRDVISQIITKIEIIPTSTDFTLKIEGSIGRSASLTLDSLSAHFPY